MNELKKRVDEAVRLGRGYYNSGNTKLLPDFHKAQEEVRKLNKKVYCVLDNISILYTTPQYLGLFDFSTLTNEQIYHIIDYLCGTNLEGCEDEQ